MYIYIFTYIYIYIHMYICIYAAGRPASRAGGGRQAAGDGRLPLRCHLLTLGQLSFINHPPLLTGGARYYI